MATLRPPTPLTATQANRANEILRRLRADALAPAMAAARQLVVDAPDAADAHQLLGVCCAEARDDEAAMAAFERALQLAPEQPVILLNYAAALRKLGRENAAKACLQRAVNAAPHHAGAWTELGLSCLRLAEHEDALSALGRAVTLQPDSAAAWQALGSAQRAAEHLEDAEASLRRALELAPAADATWVKLGTVLRLRGRADQAIGCFERARALGHNRAETDDALAGAWLDVGRPEQSIALAREVVRTAPDFVPGHVTLAQLLWEYGSALAPGEDALEQFRAAVARQPSHHALRLSLAQLLLAMQQADEALHHLRWLRQTRDQLSYARIEANALQALGQQKAAGELYANLHDVHGQRDAEFLNDFVRHLLSAKKFDVAAARALQATERDPHNQTAWAYLSTAWRLLDDPREYWLCDYDRLISLQEIEPPKGWADSAAFLQALRQAIEPMHLASREPVQQSLRGGSQTPGRLFGRDLPILDATQEALLRAVDGWLQSLRCEPAHPFLGRIGAGVRICGSWSVKLWSAGKHVNHNHPQGWMSSAFYLALPPSVSDPTSSALPAGHLQFGQPPVELGLSLAPRRVIQPRLGHLALFPSYLWHGTTPFADQQPRISIAFDMTPKPT